MAGVKGRSGRKPSQQTLNFRAWCRGILSNPKVLAKLKARCLEDPEFALKVGEYGIGRPPQAISVTGRVEQVTEREVLLPGGATAFTEQPTGLPAPGVN